ncbi:MAG: glutamate-cysteine ligase family protein [Candidatus Sifarchaeia archaeon]
MSIIEKICSNYEVAIGLEEEMLIISKDGTLIASADQMMEAAANLLNQDAERLERIMLKIRSLDPEPNKAQIEHVSLPIPLSEIPSAIDEGRALLLDSAKSLGYKIFIQSLHPLESNPHPMCGTHINVSAKRSAHEAMNPKEILAVYNHLWNHLPELIALSANTPIIQGETGATSNRVLNSTVLKPNPFGQLRIPKHQPALVQDRYYGALRYSLKIGALEKEPTIIANKTGHRLRDITPRGPSTNISDDKEDSFTRNRIETRIFDNQRDPNRLEDLTRIVAGLAIEALCLLEKDDQIIENRAHAVNRERAILDGINATFLHEKNGSVIEIPARERVLEMLNRTEIHRETLGAQLQTDLKSAKTEVEIKRPRLEVAYSNPEFERLRRSGKTVVSVRFGKVKKVSDIRSSKKYKISRGQTITGKLGIGLSLTYDESEATPGLVTDFKDVLIKNYLVVQSIRIPLDKSDEIVAAISDEEYTRRQFFGADAFPYLF